MKFERLYLSNKLLVLLILRLCFNHVLHVLKLELLYFSNMLLVLRLCLNHVLHVLILERLNLSDKVSNLLLGLLKLRAFLC